MSESSHIAVLKKCLTQCEEAIPLIHDAHDRQIEIDHANLLRMDIRRMETWQAEQAKITQTDGLPPSYAGGGNA